MNTREFYFIYRKKKLKQIYMYVTIVVHRTVTTVTSVKPKCATKIFCTEQSVKFYNIFSVLYLYKDITFNIKR